MGLRGLVSKLGTLRRVCACAYACMHVDSVVVHVCRRVCATTATLCVFVGCVSNAKWWEKKDFISIIWMLTFRSGQS